MLVPRGMPGHPCPAIWVGERTILSGVGSRLETAEPPRAVRDAGTACGPRGRQRSHIEGCRREPRATPRRERAIGAGPLQPGQKSFVSRM